MSIYRFPFCCSHEFESPLTYCEAVTFKGHSESEAIGRAMNAGWRSKTYGDFRLWYCPHHAAGPKDCRAGLRVARSTDAKTEWRKTMDKQVSGESLADLEDRYQDVHAYTAICGKGFCGLGVAIANERGYYAVSPNIAHFDRYDDAANEADRLNAAIGLGDDAAWKIVASSMRKDASA